MLYDIEVLGFVHRLVFYKTEEHRVSAGVSCPLT
jgi:hypothetical protein